MNHKHVKHALLLSAVSGLVVDAAAGSGGFTPNATAGVYVSNVAAASTPITDFSSYMLEEMGTLDLDLPNGEPMLGPNGKQVVVHIYGPATDRYESADKARQAEAASRMMIAVGNKNAKKKKVDDAADVKFLVAVTSHIDNFDYPGGVEAIYAEPRFQYIGRQVLSYLNDLGNFYKG